MQDNPYSMIIEIMREQGAAKNPPVIMLASVVVSSPNLVIKVGDLQLGKENLLVADYLMHGYERSVSFTSTQTNSTTNSTEVGDHGSHSHSITGMEISQGKMMMIDSINTGDILAVIPTYDEQTFIILAKVVSIQ